MAEKHQQQQVQGYPLAPSSTMPRSDQEYATTNYQSQDQMKRKKRMKCLAYIATFAIFQTIIIVVFALVIVRVRTPRVRLGDVTLTNTAGGNVRLTARVSIRNRNFGRYEFESSLATIRSGNTNVGQFVIHDARARARSTKSIYVFADLSSTDSNLSVTDLNVAAWMRGKVRSLWVIRRNKSANMNCTMSVDLPTNAVRNLRCE